MKKTIKVIGAVLFTSVILTSCGGGSIESDAKKVAELQCKAQQLMLKATSGDMSVMEESTKIATEAASLSKEMEGKYTSDADKQKFGEALLKEMGNCK
jgi:predicted small secreted protein